MLISLNPPVIADGEEYTDVTFPCAVWSSLIALWATVGTWAPMLGLDEEVIRCAIEGIASTVSADRTRTAAALETTREAILTVSMDHQWTPGPEDDALSAVVRTLARDLGLLNLDDIIHAAAAQRIRYFPDYHWVVTGLVDVRGTELERGLRYQGGQVHHRYRVPRPI